MLKLKLLAGCVLSCCLCFGAPGCGGDTIDTTAPETMPDDGGDPATEDADAAATGEDGPPGTE